ncbi:MAG: hypothetical protein AB203_01735 [Parcubacteria bacterium C7867-008]|nr:MAG: hypothetical protein AB203_01735 [Parcubacteria bacterium C7867-008]
MSIVAQAARHGTYVVTYDVASRFNALRTSGLAFNQHDPIFERFRQHLLERMQQTLPGVTIDAIDMSELRLKIWDQVESRLTDSTRQVVLSTCQEITDANPKSEGLLLNINRLFNTEGELIGHGARPGFEPIDKQLDELVARIAGRSVLLIEDGAFSGGTLRCVLTELKRRGLKVTAALIGFCCTRAKAVLTEEYVGELVIVNPIENLIDWIPDHDLIPFIPNCGRVLGEQTPRGLMPVQTADGFSCSYPYIEPFGLMEAWASLPPEGARELSRFCLDTSVELFGRLEGHDGRRITIGELLGRNPRVPIPIEIGAHADLPALTMEIVDFLEKVRNRLK